MLPRSKYSFINAINTTKDIIYSFLNLKASLLVNISNRALTRHNIYLSNIIVSFTSFRNKSIY